MWSATVTTLKKVGVLKQGGFYMQVFKYYIYRTKIRLKDGSILYARDYGKRAFRIPIYDDIAG